MKREANAPGSERNRGRSSVSKKSERYAVIANQCRNTGVAIRFLRSPLAPTLGELVAKPTERVSIALSAPTGHLSHRERQVALIRHGCAVPPSPPREKLGERIATPVCGLVRNDMVFRKYQRIK